MSFPYKRYDFFQIFLTNRFSAVSVPKSSVYLYNSRPLKNAAHKTKINTFLNFLPLSVFFIFSFANLAVFNFKKFKCKILVCRATIFIPFAKYSIVF